MAISRFRFRRESASSAGVDGCQKRMRKKRHQLQIQALEPRHMLDGFGVRFAFFFTDGVGGELSSLNVGESYLMRTYVQDQRAESGATLPSGILQAVFDVPYDPALLQFSNLITLGSEFETVPGRSINGTVESSRLDNLNGRDNTQPTGDARDDELLFFEINVMARARGSVDLDAVDAVEADLLAEFYLPQVEVTDIDVTGDQIEIVGGGVILNGATGLEVTEGGATGSFQAELTRAPASDVHFAIAPTTAGQVTVNPTTVTFTAANWNDPQTIQVSAVNDDFAEDLVVASLQLSDLISDDEFFSGATTDDVSVTVVDNDQASIQLDPSFGLATSEDGLQDSADVRLTSEPTSNVTISFTSGDAGEVAISPAQVVFTPDNWNFFQTLTLSGVVDEEVDGEQTVSITSVVTSDDSVYSALTGPTISVTNADTSEAGLLIQPISGLITGESEAVGGNDVFNVRLRTRPESDVILNVASSDTSEGRPDVSQLTFTPSNWDAAQVVTVVGQDDNVADGQVSYTVSITPGASSDITYRNLGSSTVSLTNEDDDVTALFVSEPTQSFTTEDGGAVTFTTQLLTQPAGEVTVAAVSSDMGEGLVVPAILSFNALNWNVPQQVTVTGVDDVSLDGAVAYSVDLTSSSTADPDYDGLSQSVALTNRDSDVAGIVLTGAENLQTTEEGATDTFGIRLQARPLSNVTIVLASDDANEVTVSPLTLTFTPADWDTEQTVTLTGVDDSVIDGDQTVNLSFDFSSSADASFQVLMVEPVTVTSVGDAARLQVLPMAGLTTSENAGPNQSDSFTVRLTRKPTTDVVLQVVSSDTGEGVPAFSQVVFTPDDFDQPKMITVTGVDDDVSDGDQTYQITLTPTSTSDAAYSVLAPTVVSVANVDDDVAGLIVGSVNPGSTGEEGTQTLIPVRLQTKPVGSVTVIATSSNQQEGQVVGDPLTFDENNWSEDQFVVVAGQDDDTVDGVVSYQVTMTPSSATDANYNTALLAASVSLTNVDNDVADIELINIEDLQTSEAGRTASFSLRLTSRPTANVTVSVTSSDTGEITLAPALWIFTPSNWHQPQIVSLAGVDDDDVDGDQAVLIEFDLSSSQDAAYQAVSVLPLSVTNADNDGGVRVIADSHLTTDETGTQTSFQVVLTREPAADVTVPIVLSDTTELSVNAQGLIFTPDNWNVAQLVTVTGLADGRVDGNVVSQVLLGPTSSEDIDFDEMEVSSVNVTNLDRDTASISVVAADVMEGDSDAGASMVFTIKLTGAVDSGLTLNYTTFIPTTGSVAQPMIDYSPIADSVTLTGQDGEIVQLSVPILGESLVENNETIGFRLSDLSLSNSGFSANDISLPSSDAVASILNDDTASITIDGPLEVVEPGGPGSSLNVAYMVRLSAPVQGGLVVGYATADGTAIGSVGDSVTEDLGASNFGTGDFESVTGSLSFPEQGGLTQTINVAILGDSSLESEEQFTVLLAGLSGIDSDLAESITVAEQSVTTRIQDDDSVDVAFRTSTSAVGEKVGILDVEVVLSSTGGAVLSEALVLDVLVTSVGTASSADFVLESPQVTFPAGSTNGSVQTVRLTLIDDELVEPTETIELALRPAAVTEMNVTVSENTHLVSMSDDQADALLSGYVWADTNSNSLRESYEMGIAGVVVRLTGVDNRGEPVSRQTTTDFSGRFIFGDLSGGEYSLIEVQPSAFHDGESLAPDLDNVDVSQANTVSGIQVAASTQQEGFGFTERSYRANSIPSYSFHARNSVIGLGQATVDLATSDPIQGSATQTNVLDTLFANW
ncbi:Calx-beta domain-containing protein [Neorhodopirellula lusitana]|uniref:Calx-beta domain-containing protein n=1 Tax=Neorhodopirellula lusitana TaxID=445327 RepID=UPI0038508E06